MPLMRRRSTLLSSSIKAVSHNQVDVFHGSFAGDAHNGKPRRLSSSTGNYDASPHSSKLGASTAGYPGLAIASLPRTSALNRAGPHRVRLFSSTSHSGSTKSLSTNSHEREEQATTAIQNSIQEAKSTTERLVLEHDGLQHEQRKLNRELKMLTAMHEHFKDKNASIQSGIAEMIEKSKSQPDQQRSQLLSDAKEIRWERFDAFQMALRDISRSHGDINEHTAGPHEIARKKAKEEEQQVNVLKELETFIKTQVDHDQRAFYENLAKWYEEGMRIKPMAFCINALGHTISVGQRLD